MSKKKKRRIPGRPPASPSQQKGGRTRSLILIENEPIRQAALAAYLQLESESAELRRQVERFELVDRPAYERWESRTLGALLTELRDVSTTLAEKQRLFEAINEEVFWSNCSLLTAYRRVMKLLHEPPEAQPEEAWERDFDDGGKAPDPEDPQDPDFPGSGGGLFGASDLPPGFRVEDYDRMPAAAKREFREFYEVMSGLYEAMTGQPAPVLDEVLARERVRASGDPHTAGKEQRVPFQHAPTQPPHAKREADRLKEIYRKLVRQLHPDMNGEFAPREREFWHEIQAAYHARDVERLEAVAARIEIGLASASREMPVGVLLRITRDLRAALQNLRQQLAQLRKQPAWRFQETARDLPAFEARRRRQLEKLLNETRRELLQSAAILDDLARRAARPPKRRGPNRGFPDPSARATQMEFF